jgi:potassium-dependent mechanosensitive channel
VVADLQKEQAALEQALSRAQQGSNGSHRALDDAERAAAARGLGTEKLSEVLELRRAQAENSDLALELVRLKLDVNSQRRAAWQYRLFLINANDSTNRRTAYQGLQQALARLDSWARYVEGQLTLITAQIDEQTRKLRSVSSTEETARLREIKSTFEQRAALYLDAKESIASFTNTLALWKQQFDEVRGAKTLWAGTLDALSELGDMARTIWNFELFAAEDTVEVDGKKVTATRSVTVGKSVGAVLVLILGYVASSWLMRRAQLQLVRRFGVDPNLASILRRWGEFAVVAVLFLLALNLVKIPLTIFAFLGGALAIGVGFGAQNLLKNLMSGIILLIERPLRVGDIVEVGGTVGSVTNISIRASTVRSGTGIETLIPNANFLENAVTNWTYSDRRVRREIKLSVPRASSTRQVSDVLLATAQRHGQLLKDPPPRVLFQDVGVDTFLFSLQYWTEFRAGIDADVVASDLRFMIEGALKDAGIAGP